MAISTTSLRASFTANGATTEFPITFSCYDQNDLDVYTYVISTGALTLKTISTHYTVSPTTLTTADAPGMTVTFLVAPATGLKVLVVRNLTLTQVINYVENERFPAETHETGVDRLVMIAQQLDEQLGRAIKLPLSSALTELDLPEPALYPSTYLRINAAGTAIEAASVLEGESGDILVGTANQVVVTFGAGVITLSLPQSIGTGSAPTFAGITFPAIQAASAVANVLDDYEEGTWTPTDGSGAALSLTVASAQYVKIGQLVYVSWDITYPATANGAAASVAGLPFTSQGVNHPGGAPGYTNSSLTLNVGVTAGSTTVTFWLNTGVAVTNANLGGFIVRASLCYRAAS